MCFEVERDGVRVAAFVIRFEGKVHAYLNRCAHIPMELDWQRGKFFDVFGMVLVCSTHGASYDPATGACREGPCRGGRLQPVAVEEVNGEVHLKSE